MTEALQSGGAVPPSMNEPTQDERTMATLAHALQLIGSWIAPLIIFLINRQSRFVSFHALQALLLQICHVIAIFLAVALWIVIIFSSIMTSAAAKPPSAPPLAFFVVFPLVWLLIVAVGIFMLVIAIVYSIKAGRGEWAEYPVLGRIARRLLKIGPGGTVI
jgi:uncharacterized Tic20 family protein